MRINNNLMAMNTHRQLGINNTATSKSLEKLSSGFRINRAGDDAAGLAISEKMRGQIRGLNMASKNAQDGISLIQTAEGALTESHAILQRMRELAVQSANDTNVEVDRGEIQKEIDQLAAELTRISETTQFNTQDLLTGEFDGIFHIGANSKQNVNLKIGDMSAKALEVEGTVYNATDILADKISIRSLDGKEITLTLTEIESDPNNVAVEKTEAKFDDTTNTITITLAQAAGSDEGAGAVTATYDDLIKALNDTGVVKAEVSVTATEDFDVTGAITESALVATKTLTTVDEEASKEVGINVSSQTAADSAITTINNAIETVSTERSKLGAVQNRLEHTIKNLDTSAENLQAAESRIRDVDMAKEMMEFTKQNILQQAATAMLAQANQAPQTVLQLLR